MTKPKITTIPTRLYSLSQVGGQCVMVLEEVDGPRLLPIWIGLYEGGAIGMALSGQQFPRPLTHDLFMTVIGNLGYKLKHVVITELKDSTFFAEIILAGTDKEILLDARPSDSVALAVRANCSILVAEQVFKSCPELLKPISEDEVSDFKKKLDTMTPEDFFKDLKKNNPEKEKGKE
ncbi:MAG: bifunctional nuclease family protein [Elusimicrobiota bacterium]